VNLFEDALTNLAIPLLHLMEERAGERRHTS
jgi:hypothetical protein